MATATENGCKCVPYYFRGEERVAKCADCKAYDAEVNLEEAQRLLAEAQKHLAAIRARQAASEVRP